MESQTPFGKMTDTNTALAPTDTDVLANPGAYEGTNYDPFSWKVGGLPLIQALFSSIDENGSPRYVPPTWGEWLKSDPEAALSYCLVVKRGRMNLSKLGPHQLLALTSR